MRSISLKFLIALFLAAQFIVACGPSTVSQLTKDENAKQLTAGEILLLAQGNTLFIHAHQDNTYLYFDGSRHVFGMDSFNNKDTGKWDITKQGELCFKMKDWWLGELRCLPVYYDGRKYYLFNNSGVLQFTAEHFEGDSKNLYYTLNKSKNSFLSAQGIENVPQEPLSPAKASVNDTEESSLSTVSSGGPTKEELKSTVKWMAKDCPGCNLADTNLAGADLVGAKLQGANLSGTNLQRANLRRANLKEANLKNSDLSYASLPGADLRDSDLTNAVFKGANLIRANFTGAKTDGANFEEALLEGTEGLQQ